MCFDVVKIQSSETTQPAEIGIPNRRSHHDASPCFFHSDQKIAVQNFFKSSILKELLEPNSPASD